MATFLVIALIAGAIIGIVKVNQKSRRQLAETREAGRLQHRRSGEFPSSCSWCKNTTLARKLIMFHRTGDRWASSEVMAKLATCPDTEVDALASILITDQSQWRRLCTEKCAREFLAAERVAEMESFGSCDYCSSRFPMSFERCINCGAPQRK
jgi:hypothetical protein